jgi:hypothetical protein
VTDQWPCSSEITYPCTCGIIRLIRRCPLPRPLLPRYPVKVAESSARDRALHHVFLKSNKSRIKHRLGHRKSTRLRRSPHNSARDKNDHAPLESCELGFEAVFIENVKFLHTFASRKPGFLNSFSKSAPMAIFGALGPWLDLQSTPPRARSQEHIMFFCNQVH